MAGDEEGPSRRGAEGGNDDKGKGKGKGGGDSSSNSRNGLLSSVAASAGAMGGGVGGGSVSGELARMLASQGKISSSSTANGGIGGTGAYGSGAYIDDARAGPASAMREGEMRSFRSTADPSASESSQAAQSSYQAFTGERPSSPFLKVRSPAFDEASGLAFGPEEARIGPYSSAAELDRPFYEHVRSSMQQQHQPLTSMEAAWNEAQPASMQRPTFNPLTMLDVESEDQHEMGGVGRGQEENFMTALEQEETQQTQQRQRAQMAGAAGGIADESLGGVFPSGVRVMDQRMPNGEGMAREQYEMHRRLYLAQQGIGGGTITANAGRDEAEEARRREEAIKPPDDDEVAQTGVYAPSVELAFASIWDGEAEGQRALERLRAASVEEAHAKQQGQQQQQQQQHRDSHLQKEKARKLAARLRAWVARGSYVDDVYGLPPELDKTLRDAEAGSDDQHASEEEDEDIKEKRAKAIRRLEALQQHLVGREEAAQGQEGGGSTAMAIPRVSLDEVEKFLRERR